MSDWAAIEASRELAEALNAWLEGRADADLSCEAGDKIRSLLNGGPSGFSSPSGENPGGILF